MSEPIKIKVQLTREKELELVFNIVEGYLTELEELKTKTFQLLQALNEMSQKGLLPSITADFKTAIENLDKLFIASGYLTAESAEQTLRKIEIANAQREWLDENE